MKRLLIGCIVLLLLAGCSRTGEVERPPVEENRVVVTDVWPGVGHRGTIRRVVLKKYGRVCYLFRWDGIWCEKGYE